MSKPKKKRKQRKLMTVCELEQKLRRPLKRKPAKPGACFAYVDDEELWDYDGEGDCLAENRSRETEHLIAYFERVWRKVPGVVCYEIVRDLQRRRELVDLLNISGRSKPWARFGLALERMGYEAQVKVRENHVRGVGSHFATAVSKMRASVALVLRNRRHFDAFLERERARLTEVLRKAGVSEADLTPERFDPFRGGPADAIRSIKAEDIDLTLDWLEPFFRLGWDEGDDPERKVDRKTRAIADVMERTPVVTDEGKLPHGRKEESVYYGADRVALHRLGKLFKHR
jgi:hypothetical protein